MSARHHKRSRHPSPPPFTSEQVEDTQPRKIRNITSEADHAELQRHYTFVPPGSSTWQERMVAHYHSHLYKEYVLADLSRPGQVGLRWRTQQEVTNGRGKTTCGNKHCPGRPSESSASLSSYYQSSQPASAEAEQQLLEKVPHGLGLHDYEVPFNYNEQGVSKTELVKLRLCLRCAPLLFQTRGGGPLEARKARAEANSASHDNRVDEASSRDDGMTTHKEILLPEAAEKSAVKTAPQQQDDSEGNSCDESRTRRRHSKHKKRKKHRK